MWGCGGGGGEGQGGLWRGGWGRGSIAGYVYCLRSGLRSQANLPMPAIVNAAVEGVCVCVGGWVGARARVNCVIVRSRCLRLSVSVSLCLCVSVCLSVSVSLIVT